MHVYFSSAEKPVNGFKQLACSMYKQRFKTKLEENMTYHVHASVVFCNGKVII
jgi:hypothetical protein